MLALVAAALFSQVEVALPPAELRWLARHQSPEGWWGIAPYCCSPVPVPKSNVPRDPEAAKKVLPLIEGLAAETLEARNRAGDELLKIGNPAIPFLHDAAEGAGDFEQKLRATQLIRALAGPCREPDLEATSLALLTFLGAGYCHLSKDVYQGVSYGTVVKSTLKWMIARQGETGAFETESGPESMATPGVLAVLAISEAYGMTGTQLLKGPAEKATTHLQACQRKSGAWGPGKDDLVTTIYALMALQSAKLSDIPFDAAAATKAGDWILAQAKDETPLQIAAATLYSLWFPKERDRRAWLEKLQKVEPAKLDPVTRYFVHAAFLQVADVGEPAWKKWREEFFQVNTASRQTEGCALGSPKSAVNLVRETSLNMLTFEGYAYRKQSVFLK